MMNEDKKIQFPWGDEDDEEVLAYLRAAHEREPRLLGSAQKGEIQILAANPDEAREAIHLIRRRAFEKLVSGGMDPTKAAERARIETRIGPVFRDRFMGIFRDPCLFPSGFVGTYECHTWGPKMVPIGVCVAPITTERKLVLSDNFRHAIRTRTLEFPRGGLLKGETIEEDEDGTIVKIPLNSITDEVREETGYAIDPETIEHLGALDPDSGLCSQNVHLFAVSAEYAGAPQPEITEAVYGAVEVSSVELEDCLRRGFYEYPKDAPFAGTRVRMRGAFEHAMLATLKLQNLI